jgi:4-amino-4-deoxy-L-arabinose transferase-like glycosyltransferase
MQPQRKLGEGSAPATLRDSVVVSEESSMARSARRDTNFLVLAMILALLVRLDFMRAAQWSIDGDEAIVGLMAKHILEGRGIPVFYYGQHYMGSLEAILAAGSFALFGVTPVALSLVPLIFSLALVPLLYALASSLGGRTAGRAAALLAAFPPSALIIWSVKARGGFIEVLVLGALALLLTARWFSARAGSIRYPAAIGVVLGIGWWVNNQILYFILPIALGAMVLLVGQLVRRECSLTQLAFISFVGTVGFFSGSFPYWLYNIRNGFPSLGMFALADSADVSKQVDGLFSQGLPIILGAVRFWHSQESFPWAVFSLYAAYGIVVGVALLHSGRSILDACLLRSPSSASVLGIVLLVVPVACAVFAVSTYGWLFQAPRYLLPVYVSLFTLAGVAVSVLQRRSTVIAAALLALLLGANVASAYVGGRAVAGEPIVYGGERVARDHSELIRALDELGITYIRTNYWIGYRLAFETSERITFSMFQEPHHIRIPEYERGLEPTQREGVPLVLVPAEAKLVRRALEAAHIPFRERSAGSYRIVYDIQPPQRLGTAVPRSEVASVTAWGEQDAAKALDGDRTTRWGTGAPQNPNMEFEVRFTRPVTLSGFEYDIGAWPHDSPRGLKVELVRTDGTRITVLEPQDYAAFRYLYQMNGGFRFYFPPQEAVGVTLIQTGKDGKMDWSIGELVFFAPPEQASF